MIWVFCLTILPKSGPRRVDYPPLMLASIAAFSVTPSISRPPTILPRARAQRILATADPSTLAGAASPSSKAMSSVKWAQKTVLIPPQKRGCHLITSKIVREIEQDLSDFKCGLAHLFLHHTSASLTINENYDSDVRHDTETFLNKVVPEGRSAPWKHTLEGPDDMPAHIKSSMFGCALTIPITNGHLNMGTWQGMDIRAHTKSRHSSITDFCSADLCSATFAFQGHITHGSCPLPLPRHYRAFGCASIVTMVLLGRL